MKPNFLIIGDLKAGSTSLHSYLSQHPEIFMPKLKELRYFAFDPSNSYHIRARSTVVRTHAEYLNYFSDTGDAKAIGEASPNYLRSPIAPHKIKSELADSKLIVCLRNPADRLYSLYQMNYRNGSTTLPFDQRVFEENSVWIKGNFYWHDLRNYFDIFPRTQIKVILFEDLIANPISITQNLYRFLEVDDTFSPQISVHNAGGMPKSPLAFSFLIRAKNVTKRFLVPPNTLKQIWSTVKSKSLQRDSSDPQIRSKILDVCRDDIIRTQELIGQDLSIWT